MERCRHTTSQGHLKDGKRVRGRLVLILLGLFVCCLFVLYYLFACLVGLFETRSI